MCQKQQHTVQHIEQIVKKFILEYKLEKDEEIFKYTTISSVGCYIYSLIKASIRGVTSIQINQIVAQMARTKDPLDQNEYYRILLKYMNIYQLPKESLEKSEKGFECLRKNYDSYLNDMEKKKKEIYQLIESKRKDIDIIERKNNCVLTKDLSMDIDMLRQYYFEMRKLETYLETIEYDYKYVNIKFDEFCKIFSNSQFNKEVILQIALEYIADRNGDTITKYIFMQHYLDVAQAHLSHELNLFFNIKLQPLYEEVFNKNLSKYMTKELQGENYDPNEDQSALPSISTLIQKKESNLEDYSLALRSLSDSFLIIDSIKNILSIYPALNAKKELVLQCIDFFNGKNYRIFINLISIQIEALFYDLLIDTNMFDNFKKIKVYNNLVLKEKINILDENNFVDITEYFSIYFNNLIRNAIAHGREMVPNSLKEQEVFALELLFDLNALLFLFGRKSETIKMHHFISQLSNPPSYSKDRDTMKKEILFSTLCGKRMCYYFPVKKYNPIEVVYWIVNPTYEKIYKQTYDFSLLENTRNVLLSAEFWQFCNNKIDECINTGYNYLEIGEQFKSCVNLLLGVVNNDIKQVLIQTNKRIKQLYKIAK